MPALNYKHLKSILSILHGSGHDFLSILVLALLLALAPGIAQAQSTDSFPVAETIPVADPEVAYGDVIIYDKETDLYRVSQFANDPRFYGVVVENPSILIETNELFIPVAESGQVPVNVTFENGDFNIGDGIVTSSNLGKGMRSLGDNDNVFAYAVEVANREEGIRVQNEDGQDVIMTTILATVGGPRMQVLANQSTGQSINENATDSSAGVEGENSKLTGVMVMRYILATIVALCSIFVTFYTFLMAVRSGVISVGRNPRAKSAIQSMVILNVILALLVTGIGVFFAISLLVISN